MIGLVLVTHGNLANEFVAALQHVVGPLEHVDTVRTRSQERQYTRRPGDLPRALGQ